jgi:hypothetical protein
MARRIVAIERGSRIERIDLDAWCPPDVAERAQDAANAWIKSLRLVEIDGRSFRDRFTYRGDSLWWFAELYLHRQGAITNVWKVLRALEALDEYETPTAIGVVEGDAVLETLLPQVAARNGCRLVNGRSGTPSHTRRQRANRRMEMLLKSRFHTWGALAGRALANRAVSPGWRGGIVAFVHSAFWRRGASYGEVGEEGYIGSTLNALHDVGGHRVPLRLVGVGPATNFRARRWWHPLAPWKRSTSGALPFVPIEHLAPLGSLKDSTIVWRKRAEAVKAFVDSPELRRAATIEGCDAWPIVATELRGIAELQFPWSARAMDEAAAALETCKPELVLTYAEAGGWGRALMLEARRRGIPTVGLQHGFIYRHWLNYQHEPDEMQPSPANAEDRGFPRPDLTLVYDGYAAEHLRDVARFPASAVRVTGSPGLDALAQALRDLGSDARQRMKAALHASGTQHVVVLVTKFSQVAPHLPALVASVAARSELLLAIKPHPAETDVPYRTIAGDHPRVRITRDLDLAQLLAVARAIVTVNSTVALDATSLSIPALVVGLPNNLSPFVDRGMMAGASAETLPEMLDRTVNDEAFRRRMAAAAHDFSQRYGVRADGRAAERAAEAVLGLVPGG